MSDVCRVLRAGGDHGGFVAASVRQGGYEALFPKLPGPAPEENAGEDPRREAVLALKRANP